MNIYIEREEEGEEEEDAHCGVMVIDEGNQPGKPGSNTERGYLNLKLL